MTRNTKPPSPHDSRNTRDKARPYAIHKSNRDRLKYGVPKIFRRYSKRYGEGVLVMVNMHLKFPVEKLP